MSLLLSSSISSSIGLSPLSPITTSVSKLTVSPYSTQIVTANLNTPYVNTAYLTTPYVVPVPIVEIDTGLNDSWLIRKEATKHLLHKVLDKWLYDDDLCYLLKYLKVHNGKVDLVSNDKEIDTNKICKDSIEDVEKKIDYIEENILGIEQMRKLIQRTIEETGIPWTNITQKQGEKFTIRVVEKYLKKELKKKLAQ